MRTARIRVDLPTDTDRSYEVLIRDGILDELPARVNFLEDASSLFVVTDSNVAKIYGEKVRARLSESGRKAEVISFPAGEANKNIETAWFVASKLNRLGADRKSMIIALGGGVVGDLAGFVASIFKRGIRYLQVPTTLLAQVDSSIGGKTGVDAPWGKNQIGTFYQPMAVVTDPSTLRTLPSGEILNGVAEIVKCAIIADRSMFEALSKLREFDSKIPTELIVAACKIKAKVVSEDEKEANLRAVLNYGHTVGHAIESASDYRLSHGACVTLGMMCETWIAHRMGILGRGDFEKQSELLRRLFKCFASEPPNLHKRDLLEFARADKKSLSSALRMSLPTRVGKMYSTQEGDYRIPVSNETFEESVDYMRDFFI